MNVTNPQVAVPARAVRATRAPQEKPAAWNESLNRAETLLLSLESLTLGALSVLASARPKGRQERAQLERARLALACLPPEASRLALGLAAHDHGQLARDQVEALTREAAIHDSSLRAALRALEAVDSHGESHGAGATTIHADILLTLALEQLASATAAIANALRALDVARAA